MKINGLKIQIEQVGKLVHDACLETDDVEYAQRLLDCEEYLRRAWFALAGENREDNDTSIEIGRREAEKS